MFYRPGAVFNVFDERGARVKHYEAGGDTWGRDEFPMDGPWGHDWPCPPGHYLLTAIDQIDPPLDSEGKFQIHVEDLTAATLDMLGQAGRIPGGLDRIVTPDSIVSIGGIEAPVFQLRKYGRDAIMIHGGGSNAPEPLAPHQQLCRTMGCTRLYNQDLEDFVTYLRTNRHGNTLIYTIIGNPLPLAS